MIVITAVLAYSARKMRTDNSIEIWLSSNDKDLDYYRSFLNKFGDEEFLVVAMSAANIFTKEHFQAVNALAEKLKKLDGIVSVTSLADVLRDTVTSPFLKEKMQSQQNRTLLNIFKHQALTDPNYQNTIISKNGKITALIATVKSAGPESRKQLVSEVRRVLYEAASQTPTTKGKKYTYHLAGPSVINAELDRMSKQDMARLTPFMFVLAIVVLGCLFRRISGIFIPTLTVGVCIIWITGCYVLCGQTMNMISNMLHPLTFIIALSTAIHLISHYYHECKLSSDAEDALYNTLRHVGIPILMTTITTVVGFMSLATSSIPPVLTTGLFMAGCTVLTFFISMTLIPILLSFIPLRKQRCRENIPGKKNNFMEIHDGEQAMNSFFSKLGHFTVNYKGAILLCALGSGIVFIWGISKLRIESDIMASFPKNSHISRDNAYIEKHLMGLLPIEIVAETTNGATILKPEILNNLISLQKYLGGIPEITGSLSVANYVQKTHQILMNDKPQYFSLPDTEKECYEYIKLASLYGNKQVKSLYTQGYTDARVSVRMKQIGSNRYQAIIQSIKDYIHEHLNTAALSWHITGIVPLLINVQDNILWSEIQSFSLAFFLTFISTAIALKSVKIGLISVIPNILPITFTLGLMGFTGMKLDAATIMIASIALGISVDNTIHIFYNFKKELPANGDYSTALCNTLREAGKTALFTSLSAAFGFMVFSFSSFKPIQYFGLLTSITIVNAILSDLLISPSCLMLFKPRF
ncbi:MAG: MMPL family transporter [Candidatus Brocadiaceae bacterium]